MRDRFSKIEIIGDEDSPTLAKVFIDGNEIHGVKRIAFEHEALNLPEITLDIASFEMNLHAFRAKISETAKVIIRRG